MKRPYGRLLLSFVAVVAMVTPYVADWNDTHIYNSDWSGHAKFHVAHTMLLGTLLGLLALRYLWRRAGDPRDNLVVGALLTGVYWLAQAGAILVPGAAFVDPEFADRIPVVADIQPNQLILDVILLILTAIGYQWQRARLANHPAAAGDRGSPAEIRQERAQPQP